MYGNYRFSTDNDLIIKLRTPSLKRIETGTVGNVLITNAFVGNELELELDGAGKLQADSLMFQTLKVDLERTGFVRLAGYARKATFDLEGVGKVDAGNLLSDTVYAKVDGIASLLCNPTEYLEGKVRGIGKIKYKNEPKRKITKIFGIGNIGQE